MKKLLLVLLVAMTFMSTTEVKAQEGMIGEVKIFAGNFAPRGWALCQGQLLPIAQNNALYSLLGTTYGGDGRTTFGLPDLRGRTPIGVGTSPGLTEIRQGYKYGVELNKIGVRKVIIKQGDSTEVGVDELIVRPLENRQPSLGVHYIICLNGIYPSRS